MILDESIQSSLAVLAPVVLLTGYFLYQFYSAPKLPDLPIVNAKPGEWFPLQRAKWRNTMNMRIATEIAYNHHRNRACVLPIAGAQNFIHLPREDLQWLVDRPATEVDILEQIIDFLQLDYTITDPKLAHFPAHISIASGALTRETGNLVPDLLDEIEFGIRSHWGIEDEYRSVCVYDSMRRIVGQTTNRAFIGLPLCRNSALLDAAVAFALDIPITSSLLHLFWKPIRPLAALLITLPNRIHSYRFFNIIRPEIRRRLKEYDARRADPNCETLLAKKPNDFLQWSIDQAKSLGDPYYGKVETLAGRVLLVNFTSIHTSSFAITHVILDLASSKQEYIEELRDEITSVLALPEHGGQWSKRALAAMPKLDSVLRESQRLNSFVTTATNRMVVAPKGITTPSGTHVPKGAMVCTPSFPVFHDPELYPEPHTFKPFRFAEQRAASAEAGGSYVQRSRLAFATTSPEYTAFGHGRHACPGRFFASTMLRLTLAYAILNYDFEIQAERPENIWFAANRIPPLAASIRVKRRAGK
ncbi:hypothetical protein Hte_008014 [Hypoxylon texense]